MSAQWRGTAPQGDTAPTLLPLTVSQIDAVMAIERAAYAFPWSRGNFIDSLAAGYPAFVLQGARDGLLGYCVAMRGVEEMHLLNITVAPAFQGRGHARSMLLALVALCRAQAARELWLEVRASNVRARAIYEHLGFRQKGLRKGYYPAPSRRREDAVVMSLALDAGSAGANDALG
jgi:ribosomal-protein-alanine N-acetyltransferase